MVLELCDDSFLGSHDIFVLAETEMEGVESEMNTELMFSSKTGNWITPPDFLKKLDEEFHFDFDPCPYPMPIWNGLEVSWRKCNYVNPPYGREVGKWVHKGFMEAQQDKTVVMLLPARTDTRWFHEWIYKETRTEIRFLRGRLKFLSPDGKPMNSAPFPSMVVIFRP